MPSVSWSSAARMTSRPISRSSWPTPRSDAIGLNPGGDPLACGRWPGPRCLARRRARTVKACARGGGQTSFGRRASQRGPHPADRPGGRPGEPRSGTAPRRPRAPGAAGPRCCGSPTSTGPTAMPSCWQDRSPPGSSTAIEA